MTSIPSDPFILLSYINTKLRDDFDSLDELCASLDINRQNIEAKLQTIGYVYDAKLNKFC